MLNRVVYRFNDNLYNIHVFFLKKKQFAVQTAAVRKKALNRTKYAVNRGNFCECMFTLKLN